ncbi:hypothetical protein BA177_03630 [Woeseia oceani]|uniref:Uncharacterized protein n=1 Tax=Woeseia oceani TaxID=1548547 RepID=A0A193LDF8_9GAMM|nr:hypothetical protein BA177_03630 [Woeseia oceani]
MNGETKGFYGNCIIVAVQPQEIPAETKKKLLAACRMLYFQSGECFNHLVAVCSTARCCKKAINIMQLQYLGENAHAEFT